MNRRELFPWLSLAPAVVGAAIISESQKDSKPEDRTATIQLRTNDTYISMSVGKDGNLWLRTAEGDWKKVVTE